MSLHRRAAKRDDNEAPIIATLKRAGASVTQLSGRGVPDLLVGFRRRTYLMEVKGPDGDLTPDQKAWHSAWAGGTVATVRTSQDALAILLRGDKR